MKIIQYTHDKNARTAISQDTQIANIEKSAVMELKIRRKVNAKTSQCMYRYFTLFIAFEANTIHKVRIGATILINSKNQ